MPTEPRSQTSQAPLHARSQHRAFTQWSLMHWVDCVHAVPLVSLPTQVLVMQYAPLAQAAVVVQVAGQSELEPEHRYGAHAGLPALPASATTQVPSRPEALQRSHGAPQATSQQT